jgi:HlyD family secretion protein
VRKRLGGVGRWVILAVVVLALGAAGFAIFRRNSVPKPERTAVEKIAVAQFSRDVSGSGIVEASRERSLTFPRAGTVKEILVAEGDSVETGTVLAQLDIASLERDIAANGANLTSARANLERTVIQQDIDRLDLDTSLVSAGDAVDNARETLQDAQKTLETTQKLYAAGAASRDELTKAQQASDSAERRLQQAQSSLESTQTKGETFAQLASAQISSAEAQVAQLETTLANLQEQTNESTLSAPFSGTVTNIGFKVGDQVSQANTLIFVDTSSVLVKANFDENRALELKAGQKAIITPDANSSLTFEAVVKRVGLVADRNGSAAQVSAELEFIESSLETIRPGFTVTAKVIVNAIESVLLVPLEAITEQDGESFVYKVVESEAGQGQVEKVVVTVLDRNATVAAVETEGLKASDLIAVINLEKLEAGDLVDYDPVDGDPVDKVDTGDGS